MISKQEYEFITQRIANQEIAAKKAGSLCADMKKTINLISRSVSGDDANIFVNKKANQINYFTDIGSALQSVALDKYIESITENITVLYEIDSDIDEKFISIWPADITLDNITITNFTSRPGDTLAANDTLSGDNINAIAINQVDNTVLRNCSFYWAINENVSITDSPGTIVEYCIIAESLNNSYHSSGEHGRGILIRGPEAHSDYDPYVIRKNLFVHHNMGTPAFYSSIEDSGDGKIKGQLRCTYANNVCYNFGLQAVLFDAPPADLDGAIMQVDFVGNIYIAGSDSDLDNVKAVILQANTENIYQKDNYIILQDGTVQDLIQWAGAANLSWKTEPNFNLDYESDYRIVIEDVLDNSGSRVRDYHDSRIIQAVKSRSGLIIDSQTEVERPLQTGIDPNGNLSKLIISLQNHILARYSTLEDWLVEQGITLEEEFSDLLEELGY